MTDNESRKETDQGQIAIARLLTASEVAKILGISKKTVNKLAREAKIGFVRVTERDRRFREEDVQKYIDTRSSCVHIDMKRAVSVSSAPRKGGEKTSRAKSCEAQVTGSLVEELKALCR